jgi:hypothetical protein
LFPAEFPFTERSLDMSSTNSPEQVFRAGTVSAAIWKKETTQDGRIVVQFSIRVQKRYKDADSGEWKTSDYFFPEDLPRLELVAREAFRYVALKENEQSGNAAA